VGSKYGYQGTKEYEDLQNKIVNRDRAVIERAIDAKKLFQDLLEESINTKAQKRKISREVNQLLDEFINEPPGKKIYFAQGGPNVMIDTLEEQMIMATKNPKKFDQISSRLKYVLNAITRESDELEILAKERFLFYPPDYPFKDDWYVMSIKQLLQDAVKKGKSALSVSGSLPIKVRYTDDYSKFYESLYDQKIPSAMKKLANKYGGKFEKVRLATDDIVKPGMEGLELITKTDDPIATELFIENKFLGSDVYRKSGLDLDDNLQQTQKLYQEFEDKYLETNTIRITPEMREKILKEGLDTFGTGGAVSNLGKAIENVDIFS
jgi:hypothetical protein